MKRAYLFDGALLRTHGEILHDLGSADAIYLYDDMGADATSVGPILIPGTPPVLAFANRLINTEDDRRFASSLLIYQGMLEPLVRHLTALRYVHTTHATPRRYLLRFADTRTLQALREVMTAAQCQELMGPIVQWNWVAPDKTFVESRQTAGPGHALDATPLRLSPEQLAGFLREGRHYELLHATLAEQPALAGLGTLGERHAWTKTAHAWLLQHGIHHVGTQMAVNEAVWRTQGTALASAAFHELVTTGADETRMEAIRDWGLRHAARQAA